MNQETWDAACARIAELESLHAADRSYMDAAEKRIAELEATIKRLEAERAGDATLRQMYAGLQEQYLAQAELVDPVVRGTVNHLEAKLAQRDRMLALCNPYSRKVEGYEEWLADLRNRAEEGSEDG